MKGPIRSEQLQYEAARQITQVKWLIVWLSIAVSGLLVAQVVLLAGLQSSSDLMIRTTDSTVGMRTDMQGLIGGLTAYAERMRKRFPADQDEATARQLLGIIDNVYQMSGKISGVTPERIDSIATHVDNIAARAQTILGEVDLTRTSAILDHAQELIANITPQTITTLTESIAGLTAHASVLSDQAVRDDMMAKLSSALETVHVLGERIKELHELKIQI